MRDEADLCFIPRFASWTGTTYTITVDGVIAATLSRDRADRVLATEVTVVDGGFRYARGLPLRARTQRRYQVGGDERRHVDPRSLVRPSRTRSTGTYKHSLTPEGLTCRSVPTVRQALRAAREPR